MHLIDGRPVFAATDLVGFLACEHLTNLERAALAGLVRRPERSDPELDLIRRRGYEHEQRYLADLTASGRVAVDIRPDASGVAPEGSREGRSEELQRQVRATEEAIRRGDDVIFQAAFFDGRWRGHADFLLRVDAPSGVGPWSYEIADTKLAHHVKASAVLQICSYVEQLERMQGRQPEFLYVALGGSARAVERLRVADYMAYYREVKRRFEAAVLAEVLGPVGYPPPGTYPEPVDHCTVCRWIVDCKARWRADDHLSLVAGITRNQRRGLTARDVDTRRRLAVMPPRPAPPIERTSREGIERVREQARLQVRGEDERRVLHELIPPERAEDGTIVPDRGLATLPPPSPGDLFFDMEGDPFAFDDGLEYLFGVIEPGPALTVAAPTLNLFPEEPAFHHWWGLDRAGEKRAFEAFIDFLTDRLQRDPRLHVYHYGSYERGRMGRLSTAHATREEEVDDLLRRGVFVDLYRAVRQGVRVSTESYSIKELEPLYGYRRGVDLRTAGESIVEFERWLEAGGTDDGILDTIRDYNRDDCLSTWRLRDWLEERREEAARTFGWDLPRPGPRQPATDEQSETRRAVQVVADRLTRDLPVDEAARSPEQTATALLANLLDWHWREEKSVYWRFFELMGMSEDDLAAAGEPVTGLTYEGVVGETRGSSGSWIHRYRFAPQENDVKSSSEIYDPRLYDGRGFPPAAGRINAIDQVAGCIDIRRSKTSMAPHPTSLVPFDRFDPKEMRGALLRIGSSVAEHGIGAAGEEYRAARDLLLAHPPRVVGGGAPGGALVQPGEDQVVEARRLALQLDATTLPIQGPPGSGKTHTGARMVLDLVRAGKKVGITATSHKVIGNLLDRVCELATREGVVVSAVQKANKDQRCSADIVQLAGSNAEVREKLDTGEAMIAAGTAWLWAPEALEGAVDTLIVDEAGQMSLANVVAVSHAARNVVMLGDPQQLQQPLHGAHPPGAERSALEHLLVGHQTIPPDRGLFLEHTRRLHPDVCRFTSEVFYEGRLEPMPDLARMRVNAAGPFGGTGLRYVPVEHFGNQNESAEEAQVVARIARSLVEGGATWTDSEGVTTPVTYRDVLVVAPYNAQVAAISRLLPEGARVGTVDRFQGQQAAVVLYSMTTSSSEDAPRGMEFLYSLHRLNVATSRARCLAILVASRQLVRVRCRTPREMRLANAFCRFLELAEEVSSPP